MVDNIQSLLMLADLLAQRLYALGAHFTELGLPILQTEHYLSALPSLVVPYKHRRATFVVDPSRTLLCFYSADKDILPRLERIEKDLPEYRRFMGVAGFDLTVTSDMDVSMQRLIMLLNQLGTALLAYNGIKVVANLRCGSMETLSCLASIPPEVMCISSTLGCRNLTNPWDTSYLIKALYVRPCPLLVYGKHDKLMEKQLETIGIEEHHFYDARSLYAWNTIKTED